MKLSYFLSLALASSVLIIGCGTNDSNSLITLEDKTSSLSINSEPVASNAKLSISSDNVEGSLTLTAVDTDNDTLTFEQISSPEHGKITKFDNTNGTFTYVAEDGFYGEDKFTYSVSDGISKCPPKTVTIDISPKTIPIPLAPDSLVVTRGCSCSAKLSWKDNSDNEDGFEIYKDGKLVCVKDADETSVELGGLSASTTYRFEVRAKNASGKSKAIKAEFTTAPALEKPKAPTDLKVKAKDDKTVRLNWSENSDNESTYEIYQNGTYLKTISANCTCTIIGDLSPNTSYTFEVKAKNDAGVSNGATVTFTTNPPKDNTPAEKPEPNKAPVIKPISNKVIKETESVAISATATDSDGKIVKYVWSEGSKTLANSASFTYNPTTVGEHFLVLSVTDDKSATSKSTLKVVVKPKSKPEKPNEAPTANAGEDKTIQEQKSITLVATATDSDGSIASYKWEENGIILGTKSTLIFTPKTVGKHTLTFTATDNKGLSSSDNVIVTATPVLDTTKPVITLKGKATINLTVGDSYKDAGVSAKDNKDGDITSQIVKSGKVDPAKVGTYIIKYSVVDKAGNKADEVTRTVIVKEKPNQAPVIKSFTIDKSSLTLYDTVYARFTVSDLDGKSSVIKVVDDIEGQIFIHAYKGAIGNGGGGQPFKPKKLGKHTLTLIADDGLGKVTTKKLTFVVKESPSTPPKVEGDSLVIKQDETKAIRLRGSDVDGDKLTYRITKNPKYGKVSLIGDKATYTPKKGYTGSDSFEFKANDGKVDSLAGEIRVTIEKKEEPNHPPVANAQSVTTDQDKSISIALNATDSDGDTLTYRVTKNPTHGSVSFSGNKVTYRPKAGYSGTDSFKFKANDTKADSASATISITVKKKEEPKDTTKPVITLKGNLTVNLTVGDSYTDAGAIATDNKDKTVVVKVKSNNVDTTKKGNYKVVYTATDKAGNKADEVIRTVIVTKKPNQVPTATITASKTTLILGESTHLSFSGNDPDGGNMDIHVTSNIEGAIFGGHGQSGGRKWTPKKGGTHILTLTVDDGEGGVVTKNISIKVTVPNQAPKALDVKIIGIAKVGNTLTASYTYSDNENDPEGETKFDWMRNGNSIVGATGKTYTLTDEDESQKITVDVAPVATKGHTDGIWTTSSEIIVAKKENQKPEPKTQSVSLNEDSSKIITLTGTDGDGNIKDFLIRTKPHSGYLTGSGQNVTYTPNKNYHGHDFFTFKVIDNENLESSVAATISIDINSVNDKPVITSFNVSPKNNLTDGDSVSFSANASDVDKDNLIYKWTSDKDGVIGTGKNISKSNLSVNIHQITLTVSDGHPDGVSSKSTSIEVKKKEVENEDPTIKLEGSNPLSVEIKKAYKEFGAKAEDNEDGDITSKINIDISELDTSKVGKYKVYYSVKDSGNKIASMTRDVYVCSSLDFILGGGSCE